MINYATAQKARNISNDFKPFFINIANNFNNSTYRPGDYIQGVVTVNVPYQHDIEISDLNISLTGTKPITYGTSLSHEVFAMHDDTIHSRLPRNNVLKKGSTNEFPFLFRLPFDISQSVKSAETNLESGSHLRDIKYQVNAKLTFPLGSIGSLKELNNSVWRLCVSGGRQRMKFSTGSCSRVINVDF